MRQQASKGKKCKCLNFHLGNIFFGTPSWSPNSTQHTSRKDVAEQSSLAHPTTSLCVWTSNTHFAPWWKQLPDLLNITVLFALAEPLRECTVHCAVRLFSTLHFYVLVRFSVRHPTKPLCVCTLNTHFAPQLPDLLNIAVVFGLTEPLRKCTVHCVMWLFFHRILSVFCFCILFSYVWCSTNFSPLCSFCFLFPHSVNTSVFLLFSTVCFQIWPSLWKSAVFAAENFPMFKPWIGFYLNFHIKALCLIEPQFWIICGPGYILFTQSTRRGTIQFSFGKLNATLLQKNVEIFWLFECDVRWSAVCISFSNNSCVDITYSPPARYRGRAGAGDGTIQHLEYKTTNLKQRPWILFWQ